MSCTNQVVSDKRNYNKLVLANDHDHPVFSRFGPVKKTKQKSKSNSVIFIILEVMFERRSLEMFSVIGFHTKNLLEIVSVLKSILKTKKHLKCSNQFTKCFLRWRGFC